MGNPAAPAGTRTIIGQVFRRIRLAAAFETVKILTHAVTLLATKSVVQPSLGTRLLKSGLRGTIVGLFFAMGMMFLPVRAIARIADPINQGIQIPGQSSGALPPVPDALWLLGFVLIALIIIARRRFK